MQQIIISEALPNPTGKDMGNEWIELFNPNPENIDLSSWKIQTGAKSSIKLDGNIVSAKSFLVIENFKTQLKNTDNKILLIDDFGNTVDKIEYTDAKEGRSLSLAKIVGTTEAKTAHIWDSPTKNLPNKTFYEIEGVVESEPEIGEEFSFTMKDKADKTLTINFDETYQFDLMQSTLASGSPIVILAEKDSGHYNLKNYQILETKAAQTTAGAKPEQASAPPQSSWELFLLIPIIALIGVLIFLGKFGKSTRYEATGKF